MFARSARMVVPKTKAALPHSKPFTKPSPTEAPAIELTTTVKHILSTHTDLLSELAARMDVLLIGQRELIQQVNVLAEAKQAVEEQKVETPQKPQTDYYWQCSAQTRVDKRKCTKPHNNFAAYCGVQAFLLCSQHQDWTVVYDQHGNVHHCEK